MREYDPLKPLVSLHIQKCSGQSFGRVLETWYGDNFYLHHKNTKTGEVTPKVELHSGSYLPNVCIHGHFLKRQGFGVADYYPDVSQFITVLREPLQRRLSLYFYDRSRQTKGNTSAFGAMNKSSSTIDVDEFLLTSIRRPPYYVNHFPWPINENNYKEILEENFVHIGVTEKLQDSVDSLALKLNKPLARVKAINSSPHDQFPSQKTIERFQESTKLEYLIYNYALSLNE